MSMTSNSSAWSSVRKSPRAPMASRLSGFTRRSSPTAPSSWPPTMSCCLWEIACSAVLPAAKVRSLSAFSSCPGRFFVALCLLNTQTLCLLQPWRMKPKVVLQSPQHTVVVTFICGEDCHSLDGLGTLFGDRRWIFRGRSLRMPETACWSRRICIRAVRR